MRRIAFAGAAAVVAALAAAQLILPGVAADQLRDRLARSGRVISVHVEAFPAIELLWHQAGQVDVHLASYRAGTSTLGHSLAQTAEAGTVNARVDVLSTGLVTLRDATLHKRGDVLTGTAFLTAADLRGALPAGVQVRPVASGAGALVVRASALGLSADATLRAHGGALEIAPDLPLVGGLLTFTLFRAPHVYIEGVGASAVAGGYAVFGTARLR